MLRSVFSLVTQAVMSTALSILIASFVPRSITSFFPKHHPSFYSTYPGDYYTGSDWMVDKIDLDKAWDIGTGWNGVKVGVIDTGIRYQTGDLLNRVNTQLSYDCYQEQISSSYTAPPLSHGTCVASIVGAIPNNNLDGFGISWDVDLVSYRIDNGNIFSEHGAVEDVVEALGRAEMDGVPIVVFADGYTNLSLTEKEELEDAIADYSGLIVCSAGNENMDLDNPSSNPNSESIDLFPQEFNSSNLLVVGSSDQYDNLSIWQNGQGTNRGSLSVDLFAPGTNLRVPQYESYYQVNGQTYVTYSTSFSGTSASAPVVAGIAALMKSVNPALTTSQIKTILMQTVDTGMNFQGKCASNGRVNAYGALLSSLPTYALAPQTISCPRAITPQGNQWYKFNPVSGDYVISSNGSLDLGATLYLNPQGSSLISSTSGGYGTNFSFQYTFSSGNPYYLCVQNNSSVSGSYSLTINEVHYHTYNSTFVWHSNKKHKAFCSCGLYQLQGHVVAPGSSFPATCLLCGGTATIGLVGSFSAPTDKTCLPTSEVYSGIVILTEEEMREYRLGVLNWEKVYRTRGVAQ